MSGSSSNNPGKVDLELRKAFKDLQDQMKATGQKIKIKDVQINHTNSVKNNHENVIKQVEELDDETVVYESVGRCFFLSDIPTTKKHLEEEIETCRNRIKGFEDAKLYLEKSIKESENNLRDLVAQKKKEA